MPRQRRKHHSRSRSRSHSHDKDRDAKRRKIELYDSPNHKRSVSPPNDPTEEEKHHNISKSNQTCDESSDNVIVLDSDSEDDQSHLPITKVQEVEDDVDMKSEINTSQSSEKSIENSVADDEVVKSEVTDNVMVNSDPEDPVVDLKPTNIYKTPNTNKNIGISMIHCDTNSDSKSGSPKSVDSRDEKSANTNNPVSKSVQKLFQEKTPTRRLTPKQLEKKLESEKKRQLKEKEKEEREKQKQLEKEQKDAEKQKKKEQKQKEIDQKQKEKEEKDEQKRQEKELKLKQKEEEKLRKQQEIDEKNKEKLKEEEKKQKAAAAFVNFFLQKKVNAPEEKKTEETSIFMPFEVKCDMKLPPVRRQPLSSKEKNNLEELVKNNKFNCSYLEDLKKNKGRVCPKTWINSYSDNDDDVQIIEDESFLGETICEEKPKTEKMKVKFLQFHENQRPAYYGTWRKKSEKITGRRPWAKEEVFDYEVDSDDDWEEEEQGENLDVMSDEEKETEPENEEYEVDNEFFVPHGHLSDDEVDDEENAKLSPESQKEKLKLLKDAFDQDIKSKTLKIKPRSIGCIWYNKIGNNIDAAIDRYLHPLNIITNGRIEVRKRDVGGTNGNVQKKRKPLRPLPENLMGVLAKLVHGNVNKREKLVNEFMDYIQTNNMGLEFSKNNISKHISQIAKWTRNVGGKTWSWIISQDVADKFNIDIVMPDVQETVKNKKNEIK